MLGGRGRCARPGVALHQRRAEGLAMHLHAKEGAMPLGIAAARLFLMGIAMSKPNYTSAVVAVLTTSEDAQTHTSHRQHGTEQHSTAPCAGPCSQQHPQNTNLIH